MKETVSRFINCTDKIYVNEEKKPKEGQEIVILENKFGKKSIQILVNYHKGKLHSYADVPAIQCDDTHTEYWTEGKLHNAEKDQEGNTLPAVISDYGDIQEFWNEGKRIS